MPPFGPCARAPRRARRPSRSSSAAPSRWRRGAGRSRGCGRSRRSDRGRPRRSRPNASRSTNEQIMLGDRLGGDVPGAVELGVAFDQVGDQAGEHRRGRSREPRPGEPADLADLSEQPLEQTLGTAELAARSSRSAGSAPRGRCGSPRSFERPYRSTGSGGSASRVAALSAGEDAVGGDVDQPHALRRTGGRQLVREERVDTNRLRRVRGFGALLDQTDAVHGHGRVAVRERPLDARRDPRLSPRSACGRGRELRRTGRRGSRRAPWPRRQIGRCTRARAHGRASPIPREPARGLVPQPSMSPPVRPSAQA